jgi:hypothetical protein
MTFSDSKLIVNSFPVYNSKEGLYLNNLVIVFEHDGYELVKVKSRPSCQTLPPFHPLRSTLTDSVSRPAVQLLLPLALHDRIQMAWNQR